MLTDRECRSVAVTILETVGVVVICCFLGKCQITRDDSDGTDDTASLEDSQTDSVRRLRDYEYLSTSTMQLVGIVTSMANFFEISNKNLYGLFGYENPSEDLMTALVQLLDIVTSIVDVESLQNNKNGQFCSENSSRNLMPNVVQSVDSVTSFAGSLENRKKNLYEQLKGLRGLSKQDCIRAMIMFVKEECLIADFMSTHDKYKEAYVLCLLGETPCIQRRNDDRIEDDTTTSLEDLQTQSEEEPESEDMYATSERVGREESEVESVQRHSPASNKCKRPCYGSEHLMLPLLERLAEAISCIVEFFKKPCRKKLCQRLKTLSDLSIQDFIRARRLLVEDPEMAEGFMVLDEEHKMDFVLMLLGKA